MSCLRIFFCSLASLLSFPGYADIVVDSAVKPSTRLGPGYVIALDVSVKGMAEPELSKQFRLDSDGKIELTVGGRALSKIALQGATAEEARRLIATAIGRFFAAPPEVRLGIAKIPRFQVLVEGDASLTGIVTLPDGSRLSDLFAVTGTLTSADLHHVEVARVDRTRLRADFLRHLESPTGANDRFDDPILQNGDVVRIPTVPMINTPPTVAVIGEVKRPGMIAYRQGMTVKDALNEALGILPTGDPERITIRRLKDNSFLSVNGDLAMKGVTTENLKLLPNDTLIVMTKDKGQRYSIVGAVAAPQTFEFKKPVTLTKAITDAGGFRPEADRRNVVLIKGMLHDPATAKPVVINYEKVAKGEAQDVPIEAGDVVQVLPRKRSGISLLNIGTLLLRFFLF